MSRFKTALSAACAAAVLCVSSSLVWAEGDPEKGESDYRRCKSCHSLEEGDNRVGPSLYNIFGQQAGTVEDYNYSDAYVTAGEQGLMWTVENLVAYLEDPEEFLAAYLDVEEVDTKMRNRFRKLELRENIAAYLESLAQPEE